MTVKMKLAVVTEAKMTMMMKTKMKLIKKMKVAVIMEVKMGRWWRRVICFRQAASPCSNTDRVGHSLTRSMETHHCARTQPHPT